MSQFAADVMTTPAITVAPETDLPEVATLLAKKHVSALPVCTADGTLVGLVSEVDILRPYRETARRKREWWLTQVAEGETLPQDFLDYLRIDNRSVADLMVRHVITASESATLPELAELMVSHGVKRVPILRDGRVVGIVSRADLVAAIARAPAMLV